MPHLQPVTEQKASESIQKTYKEIKETFAIEIVPLLFQYLANFEEYFLYTLERIKKNVSHENFSYSYKEAISFSHEAVAKMYVPSKQMQQLIEALSEEEKHDLLKTVSSLESMNAKLLVLSVGLRENIKGVFVGLTKLDTSFPFGSIHLDTEYALPMQTTKEQNDDVTASATMLAPLFGSQALRISHMPAFFETVAGEMDTLLKTEKYLEQRVLLEYVALKAVANLAYPLGGSYQEIMKLAGKKPHFKELFYLLVETFPTAFPRLLFTTAVMKKALQKETTIVKR